jgi:hypothetical protein
VESKMTRKEMEMEVFKLDSMITRTDEEFKVAMILLAGLNVGADRKAIAKFLKIKETVIVPYEKRLRESKVWVGERTHCEWFEKNGGSIAFWCDVLVAQGMIMRVR